MKVLGIDPGTHRIGWGIITGNTNNQKLLDCGCLQLPKNTPMDKYLLNTYEKFNHIITNFSPDYASIEKLFFQKNKKTAMKVAQTRGVILLALIQQNIDTVEFSPNTIKSAVAGSGHSSKAEVQSMVSLLLDFKDDKMLDDTADALAAAITAIVMRKTQ